MGRPKSEAKAAAILNAAATLFMREGLAGTSMDAVAEEAGVSKQTVYSHYKNKEALFRACIGEKVAGYRIALDELPITTDLQADISLLVQRYLELLVDRGVVAMFRLMIAEATRSPTITTTFWEEGPKRTRDVVAGYLERRVTRGELVIADISYAAHELLNMAQGHHLEVLLGVEDIPDREWITTQAARVTDDFLTLYAPKHSG